MVQLHKVQFSEVKDVVGRLMYHKRTAIVAPSVDRPLFRVWHDSESSRTWTLRQMDALGINAGFVSIAEGKVILADDLPLLDYDTAASAYWFHSSTAAPDEWHPRYQHLHVGSLAGALSRRGFSERVWDYEGPRPYMYVFKLADPKTLAKHFRFDTGAPIPIREAKAYRYVNNYECFGSVSMVAQTSMFELVDAFKVPQALGHVLTVGDLEETAPELLGTLRPYLLEGDSCADTHPQGSG